MKLDLFKPLWGHAGLPSTAPRMACDAGFQGVEGALPAGQSERMAFFDAMREHRMDWIAEISTTGYAAPDPGSGVGAHVDAFERAVDLSLPFHPRFFTTMCGSDLWSFSENLEFFVRADAMAKSRGIRVGFETHRARSFYHPVRTRELLNELPPIELTLDFSHWCVVTERLVLDELPEILAFCASRAIHVHGRVGYDQGAQVPDPRAPEHASALEAHERWWSAIWQSQQMRGFGCSTMTPEFGPDGYLHEEPFTRKPVADLWTINQWVGNRQRTRCGSLRSVEGLSET